MNAEVKRIIRLLEKTFNGQPWYGPSVMSILNEVVDANSRAGSGHSIIELVLHLTSWRKFVTSRLVGDNAFQVSEEMNFPKPGTWKEAMEAFVQSQQTLMEALQSFPDERLAELVPSASHKYTFYTLLHGIIDHDVYHLGQIAYIRKSVK